MSDEKRLETLSEEIKLLKGEIKNSLTSVRDYLLNMELPSSEFSTILAALSGENSGQKISLDGGLGNTAKSSDIAPEEPGVADDLSQPPEDNLIDMDQPEDLLEDIPEAPPLLGEEEPEEMVEPDTPETEEELNQPENSLQEPEEVYEESEEVETMEEQPEDTEDEEPEELEEEQENDNTDLPEEDEEEEEEEEDDDDDDDSIPEPDIPVEEEQPMELERTTADLSQGAQGTPKVNMLANLINWVAKAKKEIGDEMLPTFLDVYGVSGHLSLELKDVILHLAERTQEKTESCTDAEVWSQAMLSLHGILTGGDAPLNPPIPLWKEALEEQEEELIEVDKQEKPVKLKFIFPGGNGKDREYCLDLAPENDTSDDEQN